MTVERCDCCGRVKAAYWADKGFCHNGRQVGVVDDECQAIAGHMAAVNAAKEPEIPNVIKGRVQAEWFWKGVLAMKALVSGGQTK